MVLVSSVEKTVRDVLAQATVYNVKMAIRTWVEFAIPIANSLVLTVLMEAHNSVSRLVGLVMSSTLAPNHVTPIHPVIQDPHVQFALLNMPLLLLLDLPVASHVRQELTAEDVKTDSYQLASNANLDSILTTPTIVKTAQSAALLVRTKKFA